MAADTKIKPLGLRVVVRVPEVDQTTPGGLIVPPSAKEDSQPEMGEVVRLGTGEEGKEFEVKVKDKVYFKKYSPEEVEVEGETYLIVHQDDIVAVLEA